MPQTDCVVEARSVPGAGEYPVLKLPTRVLGITMPAPDVAVLRLQLPANQNLQYRAGQYVEFILRDGARRCYSMANAPHNLGSPPAIELHLRHMPGGKFTDHVFGAMKERDILRMEGPFGSFFLREDSDKPMVLLASGTGFAPIKAIVEHMQHKGIGRDGRSLLGMSAPRRSLPARLVHGHGRRDAEPALRAGAVGADRRGRLDRPHRLRARGRDGRLA